MHFALLERHDSCHHFNLNLNFEFDLKFIYKNHTMTRQQMSSGFLLLQYLVTICFQ